MRWLKNMNVLPQRLQKHVNNPTIQLIAQLAQKVFRQQVKNCEEMPRKRQISKTNTTSGRSKTAFQDNDTGNVWKMDFIA